MNLNSTNKLLHREMGRAMTSDASFYRWRTLTEDQRRAVLEDRRKHRRPWHSPPHCVAESERYLITAACYEHAPVIGTSPERMTEFEDALLAALELHCEQTFAWTVLPNHYHALVHTSSVAHLLSELGRLHGRTSFRWNGEDRRRGRKVWFNAAETAMKSVRHFWATLNYVLNNAVRHRYVTRWQDWPYCNAASYLEAVGREEALRRWREYPVLDYGDQWDPPEL